MSLYRKYRPKNLDDMVGQHHILDVLRAQARAGRFSHNYILYGPKGTGKTTTARLIAKLTTATSENAWEHLSDDPVSTLIDTGKTVDYVEIDAASQSGVDNIKDEIISKALYPPSQLRKKIYVIDEVHMLSKWAFNALLKIMEEPPEYLVFILATTEIHKVPDTIVSRCQVFQFKQLPIADIVGRLAHIAKEEQISYEPEALALIAKLANGGVRDAIKYLEQLSMIGQVTVEAVTTFLWVVSQATLEELLHLLVTKQSDALAQFLDKLASDGVDLLQCIKDFLLYLDQNFMQDPTTYASLAQVGTAILSDGRYYPQPMIVIKMHFWQWMQGNGIAVSNVQTHMLKKGPAEAPKVTVTKTFIPEAASQGSPVAPPPTDVTPQQAPLPPVAPTSHVELPTESHLDSPSQEAATEVSLMEQLIERVDKTMVKGILKKSALISRIADDVVEMIVINEQYCGTLNNTDTRTYLERELSTILWRPTRLVCIYKSKETYLQEQMM